MKIFSWIMKDTNFDFLRGRKIAYAITILLTAMSIASIAIRGFNYGIDFSGGVLIEVKSKTGTVDVDKIRQELSVLNLDELTLQSMGEAQEELMIRAQSKEATEESQANIVIEIKKLLEKDFTFERVDSVGPQVGDELKMSGIMASLFAVVAISLYIWFRFEWKFAVGALIGLFHDLLITVGLVSVLQLDFSLTTIAAILTLAGYSVNDTVVTYDRIRENLQKYKKMPQYDLLNKSLNDIFSRTILTGVTTFFASVSLMVFGGEALFSFAFVIAVGVIIGTYSSFYVCVPAVNMFDLRDTVDERDINPFGNVQ